MIVVGSSLSGRCSGNGVSVGDGGGNDDNNK